MARKPSPRKSGAKADDAVRSEQRKLLEMQEELRRKQAELQRVIEEAPTRIEARRKKQREPVILKVNATAGSRVGPSLRDKRDAVETGRRRSPGRKSDRNLARVQFVVLCLILLTIGLLIWRSIP